MAKKKAAAKGVTTTPKFKKAKAALMAKGMPDAAAHKIAKAKC